MGLIYDFRLQFFQTVRQAGHRSAAQQRAAPAQPQAIQAASIQFAPPISKVQPASRPPSIPPMPLEATIITVWPRTRSASGTDSLTK